LTREGDSLDPGAVVVTLYSVPLAAVSTRYPVLEEARRVGSDAGFEAQQARFLVGVTRGSGGLVGCECEEDEQ